MSRPRRLHRFLLNTATLASLALCLATLALWLRSHHVDEQWTFAPGPPAFAPLLGANARPFRWMGSSNGQLKLLEITLPERFGTFQEPPGYAPKLTFNHLRAADRQIAAQGVREWSCPGVTFESMPAQVAPSTVVNPERSRRHLLHSQPPPPPRLNPRLVRARDAQSATGPIRKVSPIPVILG